MKTACQLVSPRAGITLARRLLAPDDPGPSIGETHSYRELDQSANRLAHYLKDMGAGPETLIGVYLERDVEAIRSLLAIMKAGSGYLPLDPPLPPARPPGAKSATGPAIPARRLVAAD